MKILIAILVITLAVLCIDGKKSVDTASATDCKANKYNKYEAGK